ncbi:unnamed protein product, partial [marine sediment metagenome]
MLKPIILDELSIIVRTNVKGLIGKLIKEDKEFKRIKEVFTER